MDKIKITDCIFQDQPELEHIVYDDNGKEIAILQHLDISQKTKAHNYAVDLTKRAELQRAKAEDLKEISQEDLLRMASEVFNGADYLLKSLSYAIKEWCYEEEPTVENLKKLTTNPKTNKVFNKIASAYDKMVKDFEQAEKAIVKN